MATEGTPFRDRYASEARAAAARAHAPQMEEPPTPVPRRVNSPEPRAAAPTPTPPSKLLQRYLASEATKIPEAPGALEAEVRARTRALELEVARADSAHTTYHGRRRVRNDGDLEGAARGVDAAAKAVRRARAASARADKENGVPLEVLKLARDVAKHIEASSRVLQDATAVLARLEDGGAETAPAPARAVVDSDEDAWTDGSSGARTPAAPCAESDAWTDASDDEPPPPPTPPPED